jgi:hypothetical protein
LEEKDLKNFEKICLLFPGKIFAHHCAALPDGFLLAS